MSNNQQPPTGVPKSRRGNAFQSGFGDATAQSPQGSPQGATDASTPRAGKGRAGSTDPPQRRKSQDPPAERNDTQEEEYTAPVSSAPTRRSTSGSSQKGKAAPAAAKAVPQRARSESPKRIEGDDSDMFAHALNVIRRNTKDTGRPLVKICLLLNEFAKKKTGRTNENCDEMLAAVLEALADGRKVDGKDTTTHMGSVFEKLQAGEHGDEFSNDRMAAYRAALADAILHAPAGLLAPWVRDDEAPDTNKNFTRDSRKGADKRTYFSAAELADKIIGGITKTKVESAFMVTRRARDAKHVTEAIRRMGDHFAKSKPIFAALCKYVISRPTLDITENNANLLLSAMTKSYFKRVDAEDSDTGKMQSLFVIPKNLPFMAGAAALTWHKKDKAGNQIGDAIRFKHEGDNLVVPLEHRRHLLDLVFPKEANAHVASPGGAALSLLAEMVSDDKKE